MIGLSAHKRDVLCGDRANPSISCHLVQSINWIDDVDIGSEPGAIEVRRGVGETKIAAITRVNDVTLPEGPHPTLRTHESSRRDDRHACDLERRSWGTRCRPELPRLDRGAIPQYRIATHRVRP